jgi:hypothetical protein
MYDNLVVLIRSLPPRLLANDPNASAHAWARNGRLFADHELQPLHSLETTLESIARGNIVEHCGVVHSLAHDDGVVGGSLKEGRFGKVEEDGVGVQAAHVGDNLRRAPLDLVERWFVGIGHA